MQQAPAAAPSGGQEGQSSGWQAAAERALLDCLEQYARYCADRCPMVPLEGVHSGLARSLLLEAIRRGHWALAGAAARLLRALTPSSGPLQLAARVESACEALLALLGPAGCSSSAGSAAPDSLFQALLDLINRSDRVSAEAAQAAQAAGSAFIPALFARIGELHPLQPAGSSDGRGTGQRQARLGLVSCRAIRVLAELRGACDPAELQRGGRLALLEALLALPDLQPQVRCCLRSCTSCLLASQQAAADPRVTTEWATDQARPPSPSP